MPAASHLLGPAAKTSGGIGDGTGIAIQVSFRPPPPDLFALPRAVPMVAVVPADHTLRQQGPCSLW